MVEVTQKLIWKINYTVDLRICQTWINTGSYETSFLVLQDVLDIHIILTNTKDKGLLSR